MVLNQSDQHAFTKTSATIILVTVLYCFDLTGLKISPLY